MNTFSINLFQKVLLLGFVAVVFFFPVDAIAVSSVSTGVSGSTFFSPSSHSVPYNSYINLSWFPSGQVGATSCRVKFVNDAPAAAYSYPTVSSVSGIGPITGYTNREVSCTDTVNTATKAVDIYAHAICGTTGSSCLPGGLGTNNAGSASYGQPGWWWTCTSMSPNAANGYINQLEPGDSCYIDCSGTVQTAPAGWNPYQPNGGVNCAVAPTTPTNLVASQSGGCGGFINISWNAVSGATSYTLMADGTSAGNIIYTGAATSYTHAVSPLSSHTYYVRASNSAGSSANAGPTPSTMASPSCPGAPTLNFSASPTSVAANGNSTLTWTTSGATSCTASNGWTGSQVVNGSSVQAIPATKTFTLECWNGSGVSTGAQSVTVSAVAASCSSVAMESSNTSATTGTLYTYAYGVSANVTSVTFPTWGDSGGQDDLVWYPGTNMGGGTWRGSINLANHKAGNAEYGNFNTHVYLNTASVSNILCNTMTWSRTVSPPPAPVVTATGTTQSGGTGNWIRSAFYNESGATAILGWSATNNPTSCTVYRWNAGAYASVGTYPYPGTRQYPLPTGVTSIAQYRVECTNGTVGTSNVIYFDIPPVPTPGAVTCNAAGTQATLNWTLPSTYTQSLLRLYKSPPAPAAESWTSACSPNKTEPEGLCLDSYTGTSRVTTIDPNTQYYWYMHTRHANGNWSNSAQGGTFTCIPAPTGTITVPNCTIAVGANNCSTSVSWTSNATTPRVYQGGGLFNLAASNPGTSRNLSYGSGATNAFTLYNNTTLLHAATGTASCTAGSAWNGSACAAAPTASITVANVGGASPITNNGGAASTKNITTGDLVQVSWGSNNATICQSVGPFSTGDAPSGGPITVGPINANTTFQVLCNTSPSHPSGAGSASINVQTTPPPTISASYPAPYIETPNWVPPGSTVRTDYNPGSNTGCTLVGPGAPAGAVVAAGSFTTTVWGRSSFGICCTNPTNICIYDRVGVYTTGWEN